jgi:hypothetical protein
MNCRSKRHQKLLKLKNTEMAILILKDVRFHSEDTRIVLISLFL